MKKCNFAISSTGCRFVGDSSEAEDGDENEGGETQCCLLSVCSSLEPCVAIAGILIVACV